MMERDRSLDIGKGLATLFVYLGHSILYHPIDMDKMYAWCHVLGRFIVSFNMPLFFLISGYLFSKTSKKTSELYKGKIMRILIPYLLTMAIVIGMKMLLPSSMSHNTSVEGGLVSMAANALLYGGDRWFVYTLFIVFMIVIPFRTYLKHKSIALGISLIFLCIFFFGLFPDIFRLADVAHFLPFFLLGFSLSESYPKIKEWSLKYCWIVYIVFILLNLLLIGRLSEIQWIFIIVLPITGSLAVMTMSFQMENRIDKSKVVRYIEYVGKYSLQFYLFTFCYPIIRVVVVSVMHVANPVLILLLVFVLQLICSTIIVEITRRIKWLKIPCGY